MTFKNGLNYLVFVRRFSEKNINSINIASLHNSGHSNSNMEIKSEINHIRIY